MIFYWLLQKPRHAKGFPFQGSCPNFVDNLHLSLGLATNIRNICTDIKTMIMFFESIKKVIITTVIFVFCSVSSAEAKGKAPVIGISAHPSDSRNVANASYVQAVRNAGGIALILPYSSDAAVIEVMLDKVDAVIMTGGADFAPALYGEKEVPELETVEGLRDTCDIALVHAAVAKGLPVMGICRGEQLLGVAFGGSLYQDIPSMIETDVTHRGIPTKEFSHTISIEDGSFLFEVWGQKSFDVNSAHHQGIKAVPQGFSVVAKAKDGVVEAVQRTGALSDEYKDGKGMIIGVQFHPEAMASMDAGSPFTDLFRYFVAAAKAGKPYNRPVRW